MAKGAAYETSYCRRGLFGGRAYTSKEARYGAFRGCCPVYGGFKTQRMLRSRNFTGGRHCFLTKHLISIGVDPETAEADACRIEHDISAETYERLKELVTKE